MRRLSLAFLVGAMQWMGTAASAQTPTVRIDGSSSVFPITEAVAEDFQTAKRGKVRVTVGVSGTGGGFKKFCRGETDISNASRPILKEEMKACAQTGVDYIELPIAFDALAITVSPKNTFVDCVTMADLKKIWSPQSQKNVMQWSDVRQAWPKQKMALYGAGADSGTFDYFTEAVNGKSKASRGDYTASEDDNVLVQGIANEKGSLGYLPYAYYAGHASTLKVLAVDAGKGCVKPDLANVQNGTYDRLSRPLFIYINKKSTGRPEIKDFIAFYLAQGSKLIQEVHYVPLPESAYALVGERFAKGHVGTVFGGVPEVGVSIAEVLKRETTSNAAAPSK